MRHIKYYPKRNKLYDHKTSMWISMPDIAQEVRAGECIKVTNKDTGEDVTYNILVRVLARVAKNTGDIGKVVDLIRSGC